MLAGRRAHSLLERPKVHKSAPVFVSACCTVESRALTRPPPAAASVWLPQPLAHTPPQPPQTAGACRSAAAHGVREQGIWRPLTRCNGAATAPGFLVVVVVQGGSGRCGCTRGACAPTARSTSTALCKLKAPASNARRAGSADSGALARTSAPPPTAGPHKRAARAAGQLGMHAHPPRMGAARTRKPSRQHVRDAVVERGKVAVVVRHRAAQRGRGRGGDEVEHRVVTDRCVLGLALSMHLGCARAGGQAGGCPRRTGARGSAASGRGSCARRTGGDRAHVLPKQQAGGSSPHAGGAAAVNGAPPGTPSRCHA